MKAIVIRQPWATLVAIGSKTIETRPAPPNGPMRPDGVRGLPGLPVERGERIAIVAGKVRPKDGDEAGAWMVEGWIDAPHEPCMVHSDALSLSKTNGHRDPVDLPLGSVVCTVRVDDALPIVGEWKAARTTRFLTAGSTLTLVDADGYGPVAGSYTPQLPLGDFTPGRWGWMLSDPQPCEPIPCKGRQGVFELPAEIAEVLS